MSARVRVKIRTSSPCRCTWMRAPSSLNSTDASPTAAIASETVAAVDASIGWTPRPTTSPTSSSSPAVPVRASTAVSPRSPDSIAARRTAAAGRSAARAIASSSTPSRAPVRSSPRITRPRKSHSPAVARSASSRRLPPLAATDPDPDAAATASSAESTSPMVSVGCSAWTTSSVARPRHPTPTRPWRGLAVRNPTAGTISSGSSRRSASASASIFASRERVAVTASTVSTRSASSILAFSHRAPTGAERISDRVRTSCSTAPRPRARAAGTAG